MIREYYSYWYRLDGNDSFLIWYSNEKDGFVVDDDGFIPSFAKVKDLQNYASEKEISVDVKKPNLIELDSIKDWLNDGGRIDDYNPFLDAGIYLKIFQPRRTAISTKKRKLQPESTKEYFGVVISLLLLGAINQFETEIRAERQMDGIHKAKERGVRFGASKKLNDEQINEMRNKRKSGVLIKVLMKEYQLSKASVYRYLAIQTEN